MHCYLKTSGLVDQLKKVPGCKQAYDNDVNKWLEHTSKLPNKLGNCWNSERKRRKVWRWRENQNESN